MLHVMCTGTAMLLLHQVSIPMDFTATINLLDTQYTQVGTWVSLINTKLQICTPNDKYKLYQTLYLLDTFLTLQIYET